MKTTRKLALDLAEKVIPLASDSFLLKQAIAVEIEKALDEQDRLRRQPIELFVVKHYTSEDNPVIIGNGFILEIVETREDTEEFIDFVNRAIFNQKRESEGE